MCGIAGVIDPTTSSAQNGEKLHAMLSQITHRGNPENAYEAKILAHGAFGCNRLAIVDREHAHQPLANTQETIFAVLNGEIYNYQALRQELLARGYQFRTNSDTEVLVHGYQEWREALVDHLDGMFALLIYDCETDSFLAARDHIGIKPLYYLHDGEAYFFASEMKSLIRSGQSIQVLQPGHVLTRAGLREYFRLTERHIEESEAAILATFKDLFREAVKKRVQTDLPIGVIFSGGLDSSAVLSIASQYHQNITAFTVGFEGASDIEIARRYCTENNIPQHITYLNVEEMARDLPQAVYYGETFESIDIMDTCVMSAAFRMAKEAGIRIVLCGDGSDEVLAGYDFFKTSPDPRSLMTYRLANLYRTDLQRVDRCSMRHTVEARVPFMDRDFLSFAYNVPMSLKLRNGIEKWILRETLQNDLPPYIAQRPKVRMPEGCGLRYQLLDVVRQQRAEIDPEILARLNIDQPEGAYFLEQYLKLGYPLPEERYKKVGLDFVPHGYFNFTESRA